MTHRDNAEHYTWGKGCDGWHLLKSDNLSVIEERMPPGTKEQLHYHEFAQQVFYVLSGRAFFEIDGRTETLSANESIHVSKNTLHRIANVHEEDLVFIVISQPKAHGDRIEILEYSDEYHEPIKTLNLEWLEKYFNVEQSDIIQLNNPQEEIIDKGGIIFYAKHKNEIVGTATLMKISDNIYELGKMAVTDRAQGHGIGAALMQHCLAVAIQHSIKKLILYSNTKLGPAIHLYRKYGFAEVQLEQGHYQRANIKMEKLLHNS
jgi:mannose-6-phosphate isomerase-like protein (cupin superfamily)/N-acetylglutamate synthase-like GNAT family acetyltransferase